MRLRQHIDEYPKSLGEIIPILEEKCGPYLKELSKVNRVNNFMFSGRKYDKSMYVGKVRKNRKPRDSDEEIHTIMDKQFKKKFGWNARSNALFTTGSWPTAKAYGIVYSIWPVGKYQYVYSPKVDDLYTKLQKPDVWSPKNFWEEIKLMFATDDWKESPEYMEQKLQELVNTYRQDGIYKAIMSGNEIMLNCNEYVAVHHTHTTELNNWINNR